MLSLNVVYLKRRSNSKEKKRAFTVLEDQGNKMCDIRNILKIYQIKFQKWTTFA